MTKVKIILISILSIGFIGIANAQDCSQINQPERSVLQKKDTVITYEVKKEPKKVTEELTKVLKDEIIKDKTVKIVINNSEHEVYLSINTDSVDFADINDRLTDKGYMLLIPIVEEEVEIKPQIIDEKYNIEIDKFLNMEDISIFKEDFMELSDNQIHQRSRSYYQLLKNIRTLDGMLSNVNLFTIRADLDTMGKLIDEINDPVKSPKTLLPAPLLNYYKSLVKEYGEIYDNIYQ